MNTRYTDRPEEFPEITPQVLHLRDLLKWVRQGRVRVPNFQRDFTWDRGRMLNLFDSLRKQYPIGTLLFWESLVDRPSQQHLGPLLLPLPASGTLLVLDGQQRLTTLAGVLLLEEMQLREDERDPGRWEVWYDAETDDFAYFNGNPPVSAVRVSQLMGTKGLYAAASRILKSGGEGGEVWVQRMEAVSASLTAYRIPLVVFATDSLRLAVESFTRLNRSGQSMGADEMFSALTYEANQADEVFRLSDYIDSILGEVSKQGFGEIDRVVVLRVVLLAAGLDPFRTEWDRLAEDTRREAHARLLEAIAEANRGIRGAVDFLQKEGILNHRLLPYSMQLVGLAAFFGNAGNQPTTEQLSLLRRWLWVTAFTEGFGGLNPSRVLVQLRFLRETLPSQLDPMTVDGVDLTAPAHPFPARHDHRSARVRALLCVMAHSNKDGTLLGQQEIAQRILDRGPEAMVRISKKTSAQTGRLSSSPANRMFDVLDDRETFAKRWLLELDPATDAAILESCFVTADSLEALRDGDDQRFLESRMQQLISLERTFMILKGVVPYASDVPEVSAIDVEDSVPLSEAASVTELPEWEYPRH